MQAIEHRVSLLKRLALARSILVGAGMLGATSCLFAPPARSPATLDVRLVADEPDAALVILRERAAGRAPTPSQWSALVRSAGYVHLAEREAAMGRAFTDSAFARFLASDSVIAHVASYELTLPRLEHANVDAAARRALAYLPAGTALRARLYLEIKPITNSFVFTGRDSIPSIFIYVRVDPPDAPAQLENTLAHELHHIGSNAACSDVSLFGTRDTASIPAARRTLIEYLTAFGEGRAMLAAAGGPDLHPHATDPDSIRARWDRDVARAPEDMRELSSFAGDVLSGRIATSDSVARRGASYFGVQGPWYTVGWLMASTVEKQFGRDALIGTLCTPVAFLRQYNEAARRANAAGDTTLPTWPAALLDELAEIGQ